MLTQDMSSTELSDSLVDVTDVFKKFWSEEDVQPKDSGLCLLTYLLKGTQRSGGDSSCGPADQCLVADSGEGVMQGFWKGHGIWSIQSVFWGELWGVGGKVSGWSCWS